ncbi:Lipoprotein [Corallococcus soli]
MYTQAQIVRVAASSDKCTCSNGMVVLSNNVAE